MTNAATSHDYTHYFLTGSTLPRRYATHLAELLLNAAIPEDEFVREREVVLDPPSV